MRRAHKIRAVLEDVIERQFAASPQAKALRELMPEAVDRLLQHITGNASMAIVDHLDEETDKLVALGLGGTRP